MNILSEQEIQHLPLVNVQEGVLNELLVKFLVNAFSKISLDETLSERHSQQHTNEKLVNT